MDQDINSRERILEDLKIKHPSLTENINGQSFVLSEEKRLKVLNSWAEEIYLSQIPSKFLFLVEPEGFYLKTGESDRSAFSQMLTLVQEAKSLNFIDDDTPQIISDSNGEKKKLSTLRFRQIMVRYGMFCKSIWDSSSN